VTAVAAASSGGIRTRLRHLPSGLAASAALLVVGVVVAAVLEGGAAAAGTALGVALVAASFTISSLVVAWADSVDPRLVLPVGMVTYSLKFAALGIGVAALAATGWDGLTGFGVAVIAGTICWTGAQVWWTWRAKIPYVDV
jgi:hypothetical protein